MDETLEPEEPLLHPFLRSHWSEQRPRVSERETMAAELVQWTREKSYLKLPYDLHYDSIPFFP